MLAHSSGDDDGSRNIEKRIRNSMLRLGFPELREVIVRVDKETVSLCGEVPTFHIRQMAVECTKHLAGARTIVDSLQVIREPRREVGTHPNRGRERSGEID